MHLRPVLLAAVLSGALLPLRAGADELRCILAVHSALPMAKLATDVDGQLGFGVTLGLHQPLSDRFAVRASASWTGYRVDDRNLWSQAFLTLMDASYAEDRMVLRSYALGMDLVLHLGDGDSGAYFLGGGGVQRSRLYLEQVEVTEGNREIRDSRVSWPAADTPFFSVGMGYQSNASAFIEGRFVFWRYNAVAGTRLLDTPPQGRPTLRDAASLVLTVGARF
ncbi:MAG: hypothetical protein HY823_13425 [Acidobacteria bacterium]|nr:hypothetical protein [Acidobacteriota bacterium]